MKTTKLIAMMFMASAVALTSCSDDDDTTPSTPASGNIQVSTSITENTTWTYPNTYVLTTRIYVENGATLTIEPGVVVKGEEGLQAASKALIITRGSKIMAEGTADRPIIFTSVADDIEPGQIAMQNLSLADKGNWGGLIICGNAKISAKGNVSELQIEGIPTTEEGGLYGGDDDTDNSGSLKYVSIRHGGTEIGDGNEINGLTLAGVGSGTTIDRVEIVANLDDGIEWFGGTVNVTNALVWGVGDDGLDTDQGWGGECENFAIVAPEGHCFELDGPEGEINQRSHHFHDGTVLSEQDGIISKDLCNVDANSMVELENVYWANPQTGQKIREDDDLDLTTDVPDVVFVNSVINGTPIEDYVTGTVPSGLTSGTAKGADLTVFEGWTAASQAGKL